MNEDYSSRPAPERFCALVEALRGLKELGLAYGPPMQKHLAAKFGIDWEAWTKVPPAPQASPPNPQDDFEVVDEAPPLNIYDRYDEAMAQSLGRGGSRGGSRLG